MSSRWLMSVSAAMVWAAATVSGQAPAAGLPALYTDPVNGLALEEAIARALDEEPSLRAARSGIDVARALRRQAGLRPNPSVSFERREEPSGTDSQSMLSVHWPLDLFRRRGRMEVAGQEVGAAERAVADRERLLVAEVRTRYGDVAASVRDLAILGELVDATSRQHDLLTARVGEGAAPPLERDLLNVELQRLESDRLLQAGRAEAALIELKRLLGMSPGAPLSVRDTLEQLVQHEAAAGSTLDVDVQDAVRQRPDVRAAETRVGVAEARIDRARRDGRFDVSLFASYMRMDAGFPQRGFAPDGGLERVRGSFHYVAGGAAVTLPLLNDNQGEVAAARAERAGAAFAHEAAQLAARAEIASARARDERAQQAVRLFGGGPQALARRNLAVVGQSFELGRVTVFDVLAEQRRYLDVERAYTEALRAAYETRAALRQALGDMP